MQLAPYRPVAARARPRHWARLTLLLCAWLVGVSAAIAQDDPPGRVGRLAAVQGEVWVYEPDQGAWVAALLNRPFTGGDRIVTGPDGFAQLQIGSTTLWLGVQTELEALRLDDQRMHWRLQRGQLGLLLRSPEAAAELEVQHPEARFAPLRPGLYRIDRLAEASDASVLRGDLRVEGHNLSMTLYAGQRAAFWRDGPLGDTTRQWLTQAQDEFALLLQRQDPADWRGASASLVPAEMTGVDELDRYGSWQQHPEYGAVWSPTTVVVGWAPYRYGQWVWLRPWGWTWVDAAPWGFAPSHYGRWFWWGQRWYWAPGPLPRRPVFAPAVVGWVGAPPHAGPVRPTPPHSWVPLGPREHYSPAYRSSPGYLNRLNPDASPRPPAYVNRGVPGAVSTWQTPHPLPRRELPPTLPSAPTPTPTPTPTVTPTPASPGAPGPRPPVTSGAPARAPAPAVAPRPSPAPATVPGPFHGRPVGDAAGERAPRPPAAPPAPATAAPPSPPAQVPPAAAEPHPFKPAKPVAPIPRADAVDTVDNRPPGNPGERRRPPEARNPGRER